LVVDKRGDDTVVAAASEAPRARYVDPNGSPRQMRAIVEEATVTTARVRRQAAAMDASLTGIAVLDEVGRYVYMNDAHADIFDAEPATLLGGTWQQIYDDDRIAYIESEVFPQLAADGVWDGEIVGRRVDGSSVPQQVHLTELEDGGLVCVNRDVTDERRHRDRLAAIRERVETLMLADDSAGVVRELIAAIDEITGRQFVGYWRHDETRNALVPVETSSAAKALDLTVPTFDRGEGLSWEAFLTGELGYYPAVHTAEGRYGTTTPFQSAVIAPVGDHGVLTVAARRSDDFTPDEQELVQIMTTHAETALTLLDRDEQLRTARDQIADERRQLRQILNQLPQFVYATDANGGFVLANEAVATACDTTVKMLESHGDAGEHGLTAESDHQIADRETPVHTSDETVTTDDGRRLVLDTWRAPFTPAGRDDQAVLTVSTDVTNHRRQRKLAALYRIGSLLLAAEGHEAVYTTAAQATRRALNATGVTVYRFDDADGVLRAAGTADSRSPATVTPSSSELWSAFGGRETVTDDTDAGSRIATPLGRVGLLVVTGGGQTDETVQFVKTAARTVSAALRNARQAQRLRDLNERLRTTNARLRRNERLAIGFREAQNRLREANSPEAVHKTVVEFASLTGDEAWISRWVADEQRLEPTVGGADGGVAGPQESPSPGVQAIRNDETVTISDTAAETTFETWATRALTHGYQSTLSVPIAHNGVVRGCLDVTATAGDAFEESTRRSLLSVCRAAAERIKQFGGTGRTVDLDLACETGIVFPDRPPGLELFVERGEIQSATTVTVEGTASRDPAAYLTTTPGFSDPMVISDGDGYVFEVQLTEVPSRQVSALVDTLTGHGATLSAVEASDSGEVVTARLAATRARSFRQMFDESVVACRLAGKRHVGGGQSPTGVVTKLTDRQREVVAAAYQLGYYDQPRRIDGDGLGDRFGVSRSTVHEHLRTAERKLLAEVFDKSS
jgi:PAS domain S-box-containing protein